MPRKDKQRGLLKEVRAELDGALLALAMHHERIEMVLLRVRQGMQRSGLTELLSPAVDELERMACDVKDAKKHVNDAVVRLVK